MLCLPEIKMPKNCHDCDAIGISDVVGLKCPCETDKTLTYLPCNSRSNKNFKECSNLKWTLRMMI